MTLGDRLREARGDRRVEDVAKALKTSISAIYNYENDVRTPRDDTKVKLANLYGVSVQELFFSTQQHES